MAKFKLTMHGHISRGPVDNGKTSNDISLSLHVAHQIINRDYSNIHVNAVVIREWVNLIFFTS